jgi:hypothetical protein
MQEISSAILLSSVLIHLELILSGKLIMSEQKKRASMWPTLDFLQAPVIQLRAEALSQNRIWIIGCRCCHDDMEHCTVVYDNSNKLEDINQNEESILVVLLVEEGALLDRFRERDMLPETKQDGVSSGSHKATITKGCERWHPRYDVSDRSFPRNV